MNLDFSFAVKDWFFDSRGVAYRALLARGCSSILPHLKGIHRRAHHEFEVSLGSGLEFLKEWSAIENFAWLGPIVICIEDDNGEKEALPEMRKLVPCLVAAMNALGS